MFKFVIPGALGLGGSRGFQQAWTGNRGGRGAAAGATRVAGPRVVNCNRNEANYHQHNLSPASPSRKSIFYSAMTLQTVTDPVFS